MKPKVIKALLLILFPCSLVIAKIPNYPKFTLKSLDGVTYTNQILRGKAVFITFFARGCLPCKKEVPLLNDLMNKYSDTLTIVGIAFKENDPKKLNALANEWKMK